MGAPVSQDSIKQLFHFIFTGLQDPTEPKRGAEKRSLSIHDLCKVIDHKKEAIAVAPPTRVAIIE
jgi:hypothetical protein